MISRIKLSYKNLALIALILGIVSYTFVQSKQRGIHQTLPRPFYTHCFYMGVAISELRYGETGYRCDKKIMETLLDKMALNDKWEGEVEDENLKDPDIINNAIKMAIKVDSDGQYLNFGNDKGFAVYCKLAFKIFGFKVESLFYFYYLLLGISVFVFLLTFYNRVDFLFILLLFVCSHFVVVMAAPMVGIQLQTVHNMRFLPVLAILPSLYLMFLILGEKKYNLATLICAFIQASIIIFIIHTRFSAVYQIMFLSTIFCLSILWYWFQKPMIGRYVFNKINILPLVIIIVCFFFLKIHMLLYYHHSYDATDSNHVFWHTVYLGLGAHPESESKYGIDYYNDTIGFEAALERAPLDGIAKEDVIMYSKLYEMLLKNAFKNILTQDPLFVFKTFFYYKPLLFIQNYFRFFFNAVDYFYKWTLLIIVVLGSMMVGKVFLKRWFQYFYMISLATAFSFLPSILVIPGPHLIADLALLFTFLIYMTISGSFCYISRFLSLKHVKS